MKRSRFSNEHIVGLLKEHRAGMSAAELCHKYGVCDAPILQMVFEGWRHGSI